jgi:hypothetical protein
MLTFAIYQLRYRHDIQKVSGSVLRPTLYFFMYAWVRNIINKNDINKEKQLYFKKCYFVANKFAQSNYSHYICIVQLNKHKFYI